MLYKKIFVDVNKIEESGRKIAHELTQHKVIHCYGPTRDFSNFYIGCANHIGRLMPMEESLETGEKIGSFFTDIKYPCEKESLSFSHSNTRQPLHTDGSYEANAPQITFFCCLKKAVFGGHTIFVDSVDLISVFETYEPEMLNRLQTVPVTHSKGSDSKRRPIIGENNILTWNFYRCEGCPLADEFHEFLENRVVGSLTTSVVLEVGEAIFFRDEEILHGRNGFFGERWLLKGGIRI